MTNIEIEIATTMSLEHTCQALAEGEHALGGEATAAGNALVQWADSSCPWFTAGPTPSAILSPADFVICEYEG